ncbi:hypothetical protein PYW07_002264 [Mythimna separata]|uniref:Lipase domain-containing protein n=1 Tax=Mythimna separata TaxID=271217 RepID=A0AAD7YNN6_MYTSE|nr:hypothetical protein PYW07_002264 [Mythimna separata]
MVFIVLFINFICICISSTAALHYSNSTALRDKVCNVIKDCIAPPMECPNENVTFWLYTRQNEDEPHQVLAMDQESIKSAPWVQDAPIKILIHGYTGHKDFSPNTEIRPAYMQCCNYNIISVDYNPIARRPCYRSAARNTKLVGKCTAQLIDQLVQKYGFNLTQFHVIGFSLGGQTAGFIGDYVTSGKLERISGLDPARPLFVTPNTHRKLDKGDAKFVDVLHTNALERGKLEPSGHVDFYANGGFTQPGCKTTRKQSKSSCSHARAPAYYAESITTDVGFYAKNCYSWIWCKIINLVNKIRFVEYVPRNAKGLYFFSTNSKPLYARGFNQKTKNRRRRSLNYFRRGIK